MADSCCVRCGHKTFEIVDAIVKYSNFPMRFIQCENCGGVINVTETRSISAMIDKLAEDLDVNP